MIKLESLKVNQLNKLLKSHKLPVTGNKTQKIAELIEFMGTDEVDAEELESEDAMEPWQAGLDDLRELVTNLAKSVSEMSTNVLKTQPTNVSRAPPSDSTNAATHKSQDEVRPDSTASHPVVHLNGCRDVIGTLPNFDPLKQTLSAEQFIEKVLQIQSLYACSNETILFAVQHKLEGIAKDWLDAQPVFRTLDDFVHEFKKDFPCVVNVADIHRDLMKRKRKQNESLIEYYYVMLNIGRRGKLDDLSINSYIINGLSDPALTRTFLALNLKTCNELLNSLGNVAAMSTPFRATTSFSSELKEQGVEPVRTPDSRGSFKCFNCNASGHIAAKCPQPQRKPRCPICFKAGHDSKDCPSKRSVVAKVDQKLELNAVPAPVMKDVVFFGRVYSAFVDTGSDNSLISESLVPKKAIRKVSHKSLKGFGGSVVESTQAIHVLMDIDGNKISAELNIVSDLFLPQALLLGRDVLCRKNQRVVLESGVLKVESESSNKFNLGDQLDYAQRQGVLNILTRYDDCFAEDVSSIGRSKTACMEINVTTKEPIVGKRYQVPFARREKLSQIVENLLQHGIIRPSTSPHAASIVLVNKANGEMRMCVDYRALNAVTVKKQFPTPTVEEQVARLANNKVFITLDMTAGYYQIPIKEESKQFTAFLTPDGLYEHNVMPFGLVNASMYFQEMMADILRPLSHRKHIINYVDEVIIANSTVEGSMIVLEEFLQAIREAGLTLRPSKCFFMATTVSFLGHIINADGLQPGEVKTRCIDEFPTPSNIAEVRRFLGITGFFRKFIDGYSLIAQPLFQLLKKGAEFRWQEEEREAFKALKAAIVVRPVLTLFDVEKCHEVHTGASSVGLAGILLQCEGEELKPVSYFSRRCNDAESNYASHELEVLAIVETLERFRAYLLGKHFRVVTDCNAIATTKEISPLPSRIARWWLRLQEFDFVCIHRSGERMRHVDGMSRAPALPPQEMLTVAENVLKVSEVNEDWIFTMQMQDAQLKNIIQVLKGRETTDPSGKKQIEEDYVLESERLFRRSDGLKKLVVPQAVRWRIARVCHDDVGHCGLEKTLDRMKRDFWFPRMRRYIKSYIAACPECCLNKVKGGKTESQLHVLEVLPIPFRSVNIDHLGPFPRSKKGNIHIIVLVCSFSKYTVLKAVRSTKTAPVLVMLQEVFSIFGQPVRITSDRGTAYTSKEFNNFILKHGIQHVKTAVRTPRGNGQAERVNKTLLSMLRCSTADNREWDMALPNLQWSINTQRNSTTKFCPNQLIFNFNPRSVSQNRLVQALNHDQNETSDGDLLRQEAADNITKERAKWKVLYDSKHLTPYQFVEGDLVVIDYAPQATGESHKLDPKYKGPYVVTKALEFDRYIVEDLPDKSFKGRKYSNVISSDHMKPWCSLSPDLDFPEDLDDAEEGCNDFIRDELSGEAELSVATLTPK